MFHPPATPLPQENVQPLRPSSYHTMGGGLADHELAVAATGGSESSHASEDEDEFGRWEVPQLPWTPPSQEKVQPLPDFTRVPHFSEWEDRDIMRGLGINFPHHVSSTVATKEIAPRALARFFPKSGAHTRLPEDGADQTSVS